MITLGFTVLLGLGLASYLTLMRFQADMEEFLVTTGWSLLEFFPDQRTGRDRRTFPRINERRRWWTDALKPTRR